MKADLIVNTGSSRVFRYFKDETITKYATEFGWQIITYDKKKEIFMDMCRQMDMSYSCKSVLLQAILEHMDTKGRISLNDIVKFFISFYNDRKNNGFVVEKSNSIFCKDNYTEKEAERNILSNPYKRFEEMNMLHHTKTLGVIELDKAIFKNLTTEDRIKILKVCEIKLAKYYERIEGI